jgi:hypothetical protein
MFINPKENRTQPDHILMEQFRRKGYQCEQILEQNATIFIITHERKNTEPLSQVVTEVYKDLLKTN